MTLPIKPIAKICSRCGNGFQCQTQEAHGSCWCSLYPVLQTVDMKKDCMCSDCLGQATLFVQPDGEKK